MQTQSGQRTSRRRGNSRSAGRAAQAMHQLPWQQLRNPLTPIKVISDDQLESIHHASLDILEQVGIKVLLPEAREIMGQAGAKTSPDSEQVYFDREMIESLIALAPSEFTLHARNPAHNLRFGSNYVNFGTVASAPNASCMDKGRRAGNRQDYQDFLRLAQHFNIIHFLSGYPVEPVDVHPGIRHLDCLADAARLTDKVMNCYSLGSNGIRTPSKSPGSPGASAMNSWMPNPACLPSSIPIPRWRWISPCCRASWRWPNAIR